MINVRTLVRPTGDVSEVAVARLRGAALAIATAGAAAEQYVSTADPCADADQDCLSDRYTALLRRQQLVRRASEELERLERTTISDGRRELLGWSVPRVRACREMIDRAHDVVVVALASARSALAGLD